MSFEKKYKRGFYDVFMRSCGKYPSNIAVRVFEKDAYKCYTYSELYGVCEYISQQLQMLQCNKGIIGLVSKVNVIVPCIIAASHKCCTTFMFLDPTKDIDPIVEDMKFTVIISVLKDDQDVQHLLYKKPDKSISVFGMSIYFYDYTYLHMQSSYRHSLEHSFIAMTSGSTGVPKKIQVPVNCIQPNIDDLTSIFHITPEDVIYFSTPLTFDPSMVEVLLACMNGASLLIAPAQIEALFPHNKQHCVTVWQTTPSRFFQFSNAHIKHKILSAKSPLKILALGGELMNGIKRLRELKDRNNKTKLFTLYGVTEMSCWACVTELDLNKIMSDREVPLGKCLSETKVVVEPEPTSVMSTGKIILVSKTRKCIVLNKTSAGEEINSLKFVDTGDIGEVTNGTIYYRGRKDDIIKRFGHKINLQFIESTIMHCPRIKACSCLWLPKPRLLVVYFSSETFTSQDLSDFLKCKLDDKHWPDRIMRVDNMPVNNHGKMSKLLAAKMFEQESTNESMSVYQMRAKLLQELKGLLNTQMTYDTIRDKNFFEIGGTSFLAVAMSNNISVTHPDFGKFLLPHLMNERKSLDQIMDMAEKAICGEEAKPKKRLKTGREDSLSATATVASSASPLRVSTKNDSPIRCPTDTIEFVEMWTCNTGKCVDASPSLLKAGLNLYVTVGSHSGKIVTVDAMTGLVVGTIDMKSRVEAAVFCCKEPAIPPCGVVGSYDGTVVCFAIETSQEIWRTNVGAMVKSKATCCNGFVYVATYDGIIRCLDLLTGKPMHAIVVAEQAISADLALAKREYILVGTLSGACAGVHVPTRSVVWRGGGGAGGARGGAAGPVFAAPALYDGDKYVVFAEVSGEIHCRTVERGIKIWKYSGARGNIFSSIYIRQMEKSKYQMVFGCHDNHVYSLTVKNYQPSLQWKVPMTSPVYSTPCGIDENLVLAASNNGKICVMSAEHGTILAEYILPGETFSSPAVYGEYVFIGCRNDLVYALRFVNKNL